MAAGNKHVIVADFTKYAYLEIQTVISYWQYTLTSGTSASAVNINKIKRLEAAENLVFPLL